MREIPERESLTVELKSDVKILPDRDLVLAAVRRPVTRAVRIYERAHKFFVRARIGNVTVAFPSS